jgi:hypothetical protein
LILASLSVLLILLFAIYTYLKSSTISKKDGFIMLRVEEPNYNLVNISEQHSFARLLRSASEERWWALWERGAHTRQIKALQVISYSLSLFGIFCSFFPGTIGIGLALAHGGYGFTWEKEVLSYILSILCFEWHPRSSLPLFC